MKYHRKVLTAVWFPHAILVSRCRFNTVAAVRFDGFPVVMWLFIIIVNFTGQLLYGRDFKIYSNEWCFDLFPCCGVQGMREVIRESWWFVYVGKKSVLLLLHSIVFLITICLENVFVLIYFANNFTIVWKIT